MKDFIELMKNSKLIIVTLISIIIGCSSVYIWADGVNKKISKLEQTALNQSEVEREMFTFIMDLWKADPEMRKKWSEIPARPELKNNGDTLISCTWYEINTRRLLLYRMEKDSTGTKLYVDTLHVHKK